MTIGTMITMMIVKTMMNQAVNDDCDKNDYRNDDANDNCEDNDESIISQSSIKNKQNSIINPTTHQQCATMLVDEVYVLVDVRWRYGA